MASAPHVITQDDDDKTVIEVSSVPSTTTLKKRPKKFVQLSLHCKVIRVRSSAIVTKFGKRNVVVQGHFRSDGSYVRGHVRQMRLGGVGRCAPCIVHPFCDEESEDYRKSRALAVRLHFEDLMAMHERNYPKK